MDPWASAGRLSGPGARKRDLGSLARRIGAKEFLRGMRIIEEYCLRSFAPEQWRNHWNQHGSRCCVGRNGSLPVFSVNVVHRRQWRCVDRRVNPHIQPTPTLMYRVAEMRHGVGSGNVHRRKRCGAARQPDAVIKLFKRAGGTGHRYGVMAFRQYFGEGRAKTARCAGDKGYSYVRHQWPCFIRYWRGQVKLDRNARLCDIAQNRTSRFRREK